MPANQPEGCSVFALDNRPKQKRNRQKRSTPGPSNATPMSKKRTSRTRPTISALPLTHDYSTSGTSSGIGSSSSGSFHGVGPDRHARLRRSKKQDENHLGLHYSNWIDPVDNEQSPGSTKGLTSTTPEPWAPSARVGSPPGRRGAVSEGSRSSVARSFFESSLSPSPVGHDSTFGGQHSLEAPAVYSSLQTLNEGLDTHNHGSVCPTGISDQKYMQYHDNRSLLPPNNVPFLNEAANYPINDTPAVQIDFPFDFWPGSARTNGQSEYPLQPYPSHAASAFIVQRPDQQPILYSSFDMYNYGAAELQPVSLAQEGPHFPGAYPPSLGENAIPNHRFTTAHVEDQGHAHPPTTLNPVTLSYCAASMAFAAPNE